MKVGFKRKAFVTASTVTMSLCLACGVGFIGMNDTLSAYADEEEQYTTTLHTGFGDQFANNVGTWKQTKAERDDEITELVGTTATEGQFAGKAYLDSSLGGLTFGDSFTVEYDFKVANGQVVFNFRSAKTNNYNPYESYGGVLVRFDAGHWFVLSEGAVVKAWQPYKEVTVGGSQEGGGNEGGSQEGGGNEGGSQEGGGNEGGSQEGGGNEGGSQEGGGNEGGSQEGGGNEGGSQEGGGNEGGGNEGGEEEQPTVETIRVEVGDTLHVKIVVEGTSMDLVATKGTAEVVKEEGMTIVSKDAYIGQTFGPFLVSELRCGFYLQNEADPTAEMSSTFSNIVVTSGNETYEAFPFAGEDPDNPDDPDAGKVVYDPEAYNKLGEATGKVNPNFSVMCGTMAEGEGGAFLQGKTLHPQFETATVVSDFGGAYGENFTVEFDATMPLANEDINGDEGSGFYFRCDSGADCFMGNTVRLQREGVFVFVYDHENPAVEKFKIGYIFETVPAHGSIVHIKMVVSGTSVTFSFADERGVAIRFLPNRAGEYVTEHTYTGLKAYNAGYDGEADYAGLFTSKTKGKILNFTMTNTDTEKTFQAWPFAAGKEDLSDEFELTTGNNADRIVKVDADSAELGKADRDLIGNFDYVIYTSYNGEGHPLSVVRKEGTMEGLTATILYQLPPYTSFDPYPAAGEVNAGRHGITVKVADEDGYVYASFKWALRILPIELTITGVTAVDRPYDGSRVVELTGGTLVGVPTGAQVSFTLGEGQLTSAAAGTNKEVETDIKLTGADSKNFSLVQPTVTVNITKAAAEAPEKPEATVSGSTITVKATDEDDYLEFRLDDGQWQDSRVFENVSDGKHTVSVRYKDDINTSASEPATVEVTVGSASTGGGCGGSLSTGALFGMAGAVAVVLGASLVLGKKKQK